jgi:hypothetical protein
MFLRNVSVYDLDFEDRNTAFFRKVAVSTFKFEDKGSTYLFIPRSRVLLEKLTGFQLIKKFPVFYGTRRVITAVTIAAL